MIKKLFVFFFLSLLIISCGKKDDPIYKAKNLKKFNTRLIAAV